MSGMILNPFRFGAVAYDADAQVYFDAIVAAGGTVGTPAKNAYNTFVLDGKSTGWWARMKWVWNPMGDFAAAKIAHANGLGTSTPTFDSFVSGDYSETTGFIGNGTTKKIQTGIIPPVTEGGLSAYVRVAPGGAAAQVWIGCQSTGRPFRLGRSGANVDDDGRYGGSTTITNTVAARDGFFHTWRRSSTSLELFRNGVAATAEVATSTTVLAPVSATIFIFANNVAGSASNWTHSATPLSYAAVDDGLMSDADALSYYNAVQALQTALGRNV